MSDDVEIQFDDTDVFWSKATLLHDKKKNLFTGQQDQTFQLHVQLPFKGSRIEVFVNDELIERIGEDNQYIFAEGRKIDVVSTRPDKKPQGMRFRKC